MAKKFVVTILLYLALILSALTNIYLLRRIEVMYAIQGSLVEIVEDQSLEIEIRKMACTN